MSRPSLKCPVAATLGGEGNEWGVEPVQSVSHQRKPGGLRGASRSKPQKSRRGGSREGFSQLPYDLELVALNVDSRARLSSVASHLHHFIGNCACLAEPAGADVASR
jgi:hypothetical protein